MKRINILKLVLFLIIVVLMFLFLFIIENKLNSTSKNIFILVLYITTLSSLFFLYRQKILNKAHQISSNVKLHELLLNTDKLISMVYEFYKIAFPLNTNLLNEEKFKKIDPELKPFNFNDRASEVNLKIDNLSAALKSALDIIIKKYDVNDELNKNSDEINKMILSYKFVSEISIEFILSIISNVDRSTKPLSEGIYQIKQKINDFLENLIKWKKEFSNEDSEKNFNKLITRYSKQNDEFNNIINMINNNNIELDKNLNFILNMISDIDKNTIVIHDIAEKIRLLAINSSIEASHAGDAGRGFKIVSNEVKKLSNDTQSAAKAIVPTIKKAKKIVSSVLDGFNKDCQGIIEKVNIEKKEFSLFYETLKSYYNELNSIFSSVTEVINQVNNNIDRIIPVFQLSNLTIQEMENLNKMSLKFIEDNKELIDNIINSITEEKKSETLEKVITFINNVITTETEVELIKKIISKFNMDKKIVVKKGSKDIELF